MHRVHSRIWVATVSACLLASAFFLTVSNLSSPHETQDRSVATQQQPKNGSGPITVRVETDKEMYALEEMIQIKIFVVNNGPDTVKILPVNYGYEIIDSEGKGLVGVFAYPHWPQGFSYTIPPFGEVLVSHGLGWGQKLGRRVGPLWVNENVLPGVYAIRSRTSGTLEDTAEVSIIIEGNLVDYALVLIGDWQEAIVRYFSSVRVSF